MLHYGPQYVNLNLGTSNNTTMYEREGQNPRIKIISFNLKCCYQTNRNKQTHLRVFNWHHHVFHIQNLLPQMSSFSESESITIALEFCSWLTRVQHYVVICCCSPASTFEVLCILKFFSTHHGCKVCLIKLP